MRNIFSVFLVLLLSPLFAEMEVYRVTWVPGNGAERLWASSIGSVYRFPLCASPSTILYCPDHGSNSGECSLVQGHGNRIEGGILEAEFPKARKRGVREKRFAVIEFYIRAVPGREKSSSATFDIRLLNSSNRITGASYDSLNSITHLNSRTGLIRFTSRSQHFSSFHRPELMVPPYNSDRVAPDFEPIGVRVIFDVVKGRLSVEYNGRRMPFRDVETLRLRTPVVRSFAITTRGAMALSSRARTSRVEYLELSAPVLRRCGSIEEVEALPPMKFIPYSYEKYPLVPKKNQDFQSFIRRYDNPEVQYAQALRLLYGGEELCDPVAALELLRKAASRRHVLAMYELGVCYWRGYGVKPDFAKACGFLKDAFEYGCRKAGILRYMIEWDSQGRPWFEQRSLARIKQEYAYAESAKSRFSGNREKTSGDPELYDYSVVFCDSGISSAYTFKNLSPYKSAMLFFRESEKTEFLVDYAITEKWRYGWYCRYRDLRGDLAMLKQGYAAGDVMLLPKIWDLEFRSGKTLSLSEFTPERTLLYGDDPVYLALSWLAENPGSPGVAYWRGRVPWPKNLDHPEIPNGIRMLYAFSRLGKLQENWIPDSENPVSKMLAGQLGLNSKEQRLAKNSLIRIWFDYITRAADVDQITQAEYFIGRQWFWQDHFPGLAGIGQASKLVGWNQARKYLLRAAGKGHVKAALLYAELDLTGKYVQVAKNTGNWLDMLCRLNSGKAWLLKAEAFQFMGRKRERDACNELAAKHGEPRGWQNLALEQQKGTPEYKRFWNKFITADREARTLDRRDPYWPNPYELYGKWRNRNRKAPEEAPLTRYPGAVMPFDRVSHGTPSFENGIR